MDHYKKLVAWQHAISLVCAVYEATQTFPKHELFGLTSQMRRAATSVPSNIAEGDGRRALADQRRFFLIARASLQEVDTQVEIAKRLKMLTPAASRALEEALENAVRPLSGLIRRIDKELGR